MKGLLLLILAALAVLVFLLARKGKAVKTKGEEYNVANTKRASERLGVAKKEEAPAAEKKSTETKRVSRLAGKKTYGAQLDELIREGEAAVAEMDQLTEKIKDEEIRGKIGEISHVTDKILDAAIEDPSKAPQIKKFFRYYLPTTIKLLNSYDKLSSQGIDGENIDKGLKSIDTMLDVSIEAFKKRLDSLFADQALDIETDMDVMNQMLKREGLSTNEDFLAERPATSDVEAAASAFSSSNTASAAAAQAEQKG